MSFFDGYTLANNNPVPADVTALLDQYVTEIKKLASARGLSEFYPAIVRRVNAFVAVDPQTLYVATVPTADARSQYFHDFVGIVDEAHFVKAAVEQLGFDPERTSVTRFDRNWVTTSNDARAGALLVLAEFKLNEQVVNDTRPGKLSMNPIFGPPPTIIEPRLCFVLMPLDAALKEIYEDHIARAAAENSLTAVRADDIFSNRPIMLDVWEHINRARVIIADLTGKNANVFYELGIAHTVGKEVILIAQSIDDVPFDIRPHRVIIYQTTPRPLTLFRATLSATIQSILSPPERIAGA